MSSTNDSFVTEAPHKRRIITTFINQNLQFLQDDLILRRWLALPAKSLANIGLFTVFPELQASTAAIQQLAAKPDAFYISNHLERLTAHGRRQFNIQIEPAMGHPTAAYLVTLIFSESTEIDPNFIDTEDENGRSDLAKLAKHNRTLGLLNRASRILTATLDVTQVLERLLQVATQIIGAAAASVWLWEDQVSNWLVCRAAFHPGNADRLVSQRVQKGQGIAGWVAQTGESAVVGNTNLDQRFTPKIDAQSGFTTDSLIAIPLTTRGKIIGVLEVVNKLEGTFDDDDLTIAETLAATASIAIDNASLVEKMRHQMADLQARNEELDAFDHTVAHNLQNPVALIIGFADILQQAENLSTTQQKQSLTSIATNAHKMSAIIRDLLLLSSVRKSDMRPVPLDTASLVDSALKRLNHHVEEARAGIIMPNEWPTALGHPGWIEEVWENYISNAIKYGGTPPRIELGATVLPEQKVQFWIKDNGQGLTEEEQAKLFIPFTRLNKVKIAGHGLGLSIVRRIVEKSDGTVSLASKVGEGSTFSFTLPAIKDEVGKQ